MLFFKTKIKQTGLLYRERPQNYRLGASPIIWESITNDWSKYKPTGERQNKPFVFDALSCTTFSALNIVETWFNYLLEQNKLSASQLEWLNKNGYIKDGQLNCSDRFTAIMSCTTKSGNYMEFVYDSIRKHGLLPEKDFPFDESITTFEQYHDESKITKEMKDKARKFLDIFELQYEQLTGTDKKTIREAIKYSPLHIGAGGHAVVLLNEKYIFDSYDPYYKKLKKSIDFGFKVRLVVKKPITTSVVLKREKDTGKETTGTLTAQKDGNTLILKTLELSWKDNQRNVSCIPKGRYLCKYTYSPKLKKNTYQIMSVPNRDGIRKHTANYFYQIEGCIALGMDLKDINNDGQLDTRNSTIAIELFEKFMDYKDYYLDIV